MKHTAYWWGYLVLCAVLALLSYYIVFNAEWLFGDDYIMMKHSGFGKMFDMGYVIQPKAGRFFPTSYFPWQFLPLFFDGYISARIHLGVKALMLCTFSIIVFTLFKDVLGSIKMKCSVAIILVATLAITFRVYEDCLYLFSTSPIGFLSLAFSIWMTYKYYSNKSTVFEILALLSLNLYIYSSEVNFIFPLAFAFFVLLHGWKKLSAEDRLFWFLILLSSILYLVLYYFIVFRFTTKAYDGSHGSTDTALMNAFKMFYGQKIYWIGLVVFVVRSIRMIKGKAKYDLFFDSLLLSGFALILGCFILRLNLTTYYYGACIIMLLSILYFSSKCLDSRIVLMISFAIMIVFSLQIPDKIQKAQSSRTFARARMDAVATLYNEGHTFVWYWPDAAPYGSDEWHRIYMQTYIRYKTHDETFDFLYRGNDDLFDELTPNDIVVYAKLGDDFVDRPSFFKTMNLLIDTGEITFWQAK